MTTRPSCLTDELIKGAITNLYGISLSSIWICLRGWTSPFKNDFDQCKEAFFYITGKLMEEGKLKLASHGKFLEGSIVEQLQQFRDV